MFVHYIDANHRNKHGLCVLTLCSIQGSRVVVQLTGDMNLQLRKMYRLATVPCHVEPSPFCPIRNLRS